MDLQLGLASPKSPKPKPARRKLQKCDPKLRPSKTKRGSGDSTSSRKTDISTPLPSPRPVQNGGAPDLSDSKWSHYLRPKTIIGPASPEPEPKPMFKLPKQQNQRATPEFTHLTIHDPAARPSLDSSSIPSPASTSTTSTMRRQARTPVFRLGQSEGKPWYGRDLDIAEKTSSVDLIAEQYQALLESRDTAETGSIYADSQTQTEPQTEPWQHILDVPFSSMLGSTQAKPQPRPRSQLGSLKLSPAVDRSFYHEEHEYHDQEEEVMGFEEDVIYFKPISFSNETSPEPSLRLSGPYSDFPTANRPTSEDSLSLQICLDLLTRELGSAVADRPLRAGPDNAALQIWIMIEAYERLRDQVTRMAAGNPEIGKVGHIFDSWLGALYSIHRSMTVPKESEYLGLEEDVD